MADKEYTVKGSKEQIENFNEACENMVDNPPHIIKDKFDVPESDYGTTLTWKNSKSSQMIDYCFNNFTNELQIRFKNNKVYKYRVSVSDYVGFDEAESQGKYFHKYIKSQEIKETKSL